MKRTDTKLPEGSSWWRKTGGGGLHLTIGGRVKIIKPNERFAAREEDIPLGFRDVVILDNPTERAAKEADKLRPSKPQKMEYAVNHRGGGYWDVVDLAGNRQNAKALRKPEAEALLENLIG